ncbi:hypothetical protein J3E64_003356 [Sphingobium sp. OAS761]|uniref:hypothetical protein n=1 Tax=Sphingobium sp. OAS761 TaxID=2817901 RepID=UPI0020A077CD|nr:hypothetical protein [Sphingobium sp. OAS761]MCP1471645.1 hypothetical protein [Sphingobium sp. OAS761]
MSRRKDPAITADFLDQLLAGSDAVAALDPPGIMTHVRCETIPTFPKRTKESTSARFRPLSTDPATDLAALVHDALFGWLAADDHIHLKNLGLLRITAPDATAFTSSHVAPPDERFRRTSHGFGSDRMALRANGKDDGLARRGTDRKHVIFSGRM